MNTGCIVVDQNIPGAADCFAGLGKVRLVDGRRLRAADLVDADALMVRSVSPVDEGLLAGTPVRFVGSATSGLDHIDQAYLQHTNIGFAYAPGANANSVVEYVLSAIAAVGDTLERLLDGARVGVVGYGSIGKALCARLHSLGVDHCVYDPWLEDVNIPAVASLDEVLCCDVITLHPELTAQQPWPSYHLLDSSNLEALMSHQLLINASRGEVVDGDALKSRLAGASCARVVLDVWEGEPCVDASLLSRVALGTAHIAGYSLDGKIKGTRMLAEALASHWQAELPAGDQALAPAPTIYLDSGLDTPQMIRYLLNQRYDIRRDDEFLRQSMADADPATAFDALRRNYRERRELAASRVVAQGLSTAQRQLVTALGCEVAP